MALWFPDWPVRAALLGGGVRPPLAVSANHRIRVCDTLARAAGVRRGMRVRQARAVCPDLEVLADDPDRDSRMFESIAGGLDDVASAVEVLRPGLVVVDALAAGRYHGGEGRAAELLIDAASRRGVDCLAGIADDINTALIAARVGAVVPTGGSAQFLRRRPVELLVAETALGCEPGVVDSLIQLGIRTLGELADLPSTAVGTRFGRAGQHCHRIAAGVPDRRVAPKLPGADLAVAITPEEPVERVDAAAFVARSLAAKLHQGLQEAGLVCLRMKVVAELTDGRRLERTWRTREALSEQATADRVRWQLDGWLTAGGAGTITTLLLEPVEVSAPEILGELWRSGADTDQARRVISRVQSTLGVDAVIQPRLQGGRGVGERISFVPYGDAPGQPDTGTWPGKILGPLPARLGPDTPVQLEDGRGGMVLVTAEALLNVAPAVLRGAGVGTYRVLGWAGPWPVDTPDQRCARLQVMGQKAGDDTPRAWLLVWRDRCWRVEAEY